MAEPLPQPEGTALQQAYTDKLMATYRANLYFFHQQFPEIFQEIMAVPLPAPFEVGPNGELTIFYGRFKGTPREFTDLGRMLYQIFESSKTRPRISVDHAYVENPMQAYPHMDNPDFYRHVEPTFRKELLESFHAVAPEGEARLTGADFGERKLPIALVFGSGYGWHLDRLVDDWEIRHLILVDTDIQRLNLSLYFVDYVSLHQRFSTKGFYFSIAFNADGEKLADHLRSLIFHYWPPYFIQGAGLFFNDYDSEQVHSLWGRMRRDLWTLYRGWGFLDDEILGLKQGLENAIDRHPLYTRKPDIPADAVAFIVGAGPSLDGLLPVLRAHAGKAFIISCGTAITALARAGIKPDLHVEIERTYMTYVVLEDPQTRDFVKDVPIAALSIMHPAVFTATNKPLMFLKELDLGAYLADFFGEHQRFRSGPTCTNGGLDIALRMGFKRAYLFGVDYGFRDPAHHHAKSSIYFDKEAEKSGDLERIVDQTHASHKRGDAVPGNFGEDVLSTEIFIHSRDSMVLSVREHPDAKVFNLNDGAAINGTHPLHAEELVLELDPSAKQAVVDAALSAFTQNYDANPFECLNLLLEQLTAVREDLTRILSGELKSKMDVADKLYDMHHYLFDERHQSAQVFPLVRGSMLHMGRFLFDCMSLIRDEAAAIEFARSGFGLFDRFLQAGHETMASLHDVGKARRHANALKEAAKKGVAA